MRALLNDEGKKVWGYVFPDGAIPIKGISSFEAHIEGNGKLQVYLVDWAALSSDQRGLIIEHLKSRFNGSEDEVLAQITKSGLPLRAALVSCVSIPARFF